MARKVVDEIVAVYDMDAKPYLAGVQSILAADKRLIQSHKEASARSFGQFGSFVSGVGGAATVASAGVASLGVGLAGLVVTSIKAAAEFDTMERKLAAVTGEAERARQVMKFVDELAIPSIFGSADLAAAATTLEAFRLQTEKYLPVAEKLATIFGGTTEALESYVTALGYIKGGRFGEAFESLARAGISRKDLAPFGLKFDKQGSFLGDADQALDAVEKLVTERYGKVAKEMESGPAAKLASLWDNLTRNLRKFGQAGLTFVLPIIDSMATKLGNLAKSGAIERIGKGFFSMFGSSGTVADGVTSMVASLLALFETGPKLMRGLVRGFDTIKEALKVTASLMVGMFLAGPLVTGIKTMITLIKSMAFAWAAGATAANMFAVATGVGLKQALASLAIGAATAAASYYVIDKMTSTAGSAFMDSPSTQEYLDSKKRIEKEMNGKGKGPMETMLGAVIESVKGKQQPGLAGQASTIPVLNRIAENTDPLRELASQILGGGARSRNALNRSDISSLRGSSGGASPQQRILSALGDWMREEQAASGYYTRREI